VAKGNWCRHNIMRTIKTIKVYYYALLREERGLGEEFLETTALTAEELYQELSKKYKFKLATDVLKVAVNNEFTQWQNKLRDNDSIVFIPPVAGG